MPYAKRKYKRGRKRTPRTVQSRRRNKASNGPSRYVVPGYTRNKGFYGRYQSTPANQELKFRDTSVTATVPATVGNLDSSLHLIPQGVAENERIGRKIFVKDIEVRGNFEFLNRSADPGRGFTRVRLIIALDKQCNGAVVGTNDLLQNDDVDSFYEQSNSGRFQVLHDAVYILSTTTLDNQATPEFAATSRSFRFKKKCNIPVQFTGATGVITEIQSNNVFMQNIADTAAIVEMNLNIRVRYTD